VHALSVSRVSIDEVIERRSDLGRRARSAFSPCACVGRSGTTRLALSARGRLTDGY